MGLKMPQNADSGAYTPTETNSNLVLGTKKTAKPGESGASENKQGVKSGVKQTPGLEYRKRFMTTKLPYKLPTICRCKSGEWFIQFYYEYPDQPGKYKPFKVKDGINRIHDPMQKEKAAQRLAKDIRYWLEVLDYNPFEQERDIIKQVAEASGWALLDACSRFREFCDGQNYALRTIRTYSNYIGDFEKWLGESGRGAALARDFTEHDLSKFLRDTGFKWSARTFNNYSKFLGGFFARCWKLEKAISRGVVYAFDMDNVDLKITKSQRNKPYTPVLANRIKAELRKGDSNLRDYIEWIYLSLMRPAEIRALRVQDIDEQSRHIRIIGKTGDRLIPISDQLLALIRRRVSGANPGWYVFGQAGRTCANRMSVDYFLNKYRGLLNDLNISDDYGPYSWKSTAICDMINAGFTDKEIMVLSGHKTQKAFEIYKRDLVIDNSHLMKGSVIEF